VRCCLLVVGGGGGVKFILDDKASVVVCNYSLARPALPVRSSLHAINVSALFTRCQFCCRRSIVLLCCRSTAN